jgi:pimeloyl-ACP methyl ester carboxylesterase
VLLVENGHPGEAAAQLGVEVAADPFDEEVLGLYMRALAASGRRREALSAFRRYSEILAEESGLEPSAAIKELELGILVDDGVVEPSAKRAVLDMSVSYVDLGDEITVAVGRTGVGPPLVVHPGWLSKLDLTAAGLDFRSRFWARLAESFELVLFDRFGTGLSTGNPETSLRAGVEELKRVIRTLGGPVPVLGASAGGPIAVLAAAEAPELFSHLILYGTYASGPAIFPKAVADSMVSMVASSWGMGSDVLSTLIDPEGSSQTRQEYAEFQKTSATPEVASGYLRQLYEADVSGHLRELETPTLVIHYSGDKAIPARGGDQLARGIPGSTYLPLEGTTHYPLLQDFDRVARAIEEFVTEG